MLRVKSVATIIKFGGVTHFILYEIRFPSYFIQMFHFVSCIQSDISSITEGTPKSGSEHSSKQRLRQSKKVKKKLLQVFSGCPISDIKRDQTKKSSLTGTFSVKSSMYCILVMNLGSYMNTCITCSRTKTDNLLCVLQLQIFLVRSADNTVEVTLVGTKTIGFFDGLRHFFARCLG